MRRVENLHLAFRSRWIHVAVKRKLPNKFLLYGGSQWWTLSSDCIEWVVNFIKDNPRLVNYFRYTFIPDELFFHTIIMNSPFKDSVMNENLRYIDFSRGNPNPPAVLHSEDFDDLPNDSNMLFARKFDIQRDSKILDLIDQKIINSP